MNEQAGKQNYISNELTHFVGRKKPTDDERFGLLCRILRSGKLGTGKGNMLLKLWKPLAGNELVIPEMVCFCDIPLGDIAIHITKYSRFGIAFTKTFMRNFGCNPVYYVSAKSPCTDHRYGEGDQRRKTTWGEFFEEAFKQWYPTVTNACPMHLTAIQNLLLWYILGHIKFFDSTLRDDDERNYYMEREWRLIGSMEFQLADVARVILPKSYVQRFRDECGGFPINRIHAV